MFEQGVDFHGRQPLAVVMDGLSQYTFGAEVPLMPLRLSGWRQQVARQRPALLLVESAWWGADSSWHGKVSTAAPALQELLHWCRGAGVPTVFWNKEDPVHFDRFLQTAALFDWVFTTDAGVIPHYKATLGHDRVGLLPFAAQPRMHHPVQVAPRAQAACFAGSYYVRYPQRTHALRQMLAGLGAVLPIRIYDRYLNSTDANYRFPDEYRRWIVGTLKEDELPRAYKTHLLGINLNTVRSSATMCARRMFELLGSGTVVFSNSTPAVRQLFGDVVLTGHSAEEYEQAARGLLSDPKAWTARSMAGVRAVMRHHTIAHRLDKVYRLVLGHLFMQPAPKLAAVAPVAHAEDVAGIVAFLRCQFRKPDHLVLLAGQKGAELSAEVNAQHIQQATGVATHVVGAGSWQHLRMEDMRTQLAIGLPEQAALWWTQLPPRQEATAVYLEDWMHAAAYSKAVLVGYAQVDQPRPGVPRLDATGAKGGRWMVQHSVCDQLKVDEWLQGEWLRNITSADQGVLLPETAPWKHVQAPEPELYPELEARSDAQGPWVRPASVVPHIDAQTLAAWCAPWNGNASTATLDQHGWFVVSELPDDDTAEHWARSSVGTSMVRAHGVWRLRLEMTGMLRIHMGVRCWNEEEDRLLGEWHFSPNENAELRLPFGTRKLQLGWKIKGGGSGRIKALHLGWPGWASGPSDGEGP